MVVLVLFFIYLFEYFILGKGLCREKWFLICNGLSFGYDYIMNKNGEKIIICNILIYLF